MAVNVATLTAKLTADTRDFERGVGSARREMGNLEQSTTRSTKLMDRQIGNTGFTIGNAVTAGAGIAAGAVISFTKDSIRAASDLNESINAVKVVFGEASDGIMEIGERSADSFGMSQSSFNEFAVRFSAFAKNIAEEDGRSIIDVVDEMSQRVADFASVHNLSLEEAQQVASSTLAGETEVFRRFGGDVSAAAVQQKALEMGLGDTTGALSEQEKQLVRYKLFMEQTNKTAGDFKNTQDELANATRTANARMEDAKAKIGDALLPVIADVTSAFAGFVGWLDELNVTMPATGEQFSALTGIVKSFTGIFGVVTLVKDVWTGFFGKDVKDAVPTTDEMVAHTQSLESELDALHGTTKKVAAENRRAVPSIEALKFAQERAENAARDHRQALLDQQETLRNISDPISHAISLYGDAEQAQEDLNQAIRNYGTDSDQARDAALELAGVNGELMQAMIDLKNQGVDPTGSAAREMFTRMGIPQDVIDKIFADFDRIQAEAGKTVLRMPVAIPDIHAASNGTFYKSGTRTFYQHGGPFQANQPMVVGERGPELVSFDRSGMVSANTERSSGGGMAPTIVLQNHGVIGSEAELERWIRSSLAKYRRRNGAHAL